MLLDDAHSRIELRRHDIASETLVVTFDPIGHAWNVPAFGHAFLERLAVDVVAVRKKSENFYQPLSKQAFDDAVRPVADRYTRVVAYGSSLGAYAALYFGRDQPWTVVASSPRVSVHPIYGHRHWQQRTTFRHERLAGRPTAGCHAILIYDPFDAVDRRYVSREVLPQFPTADVLRVPFSGHPSNQFLGDIGFIGPFVRAVIAGTAWPPLRRRDLRDLSASYFQALAQTCLEHGHLVWADALLARSLALRPNRMPAHRTLGMLRMAQQDWGAAVTALEAALALNPEEPTLHSQLDLARRRLRPEAMLRAASGAPVRAWLRALRRVLRR